MDLKTFQEAVASFYHHNRAARHLRRDFEKWSDDRLVKALGEAGVLTTGSRDERACRLVRYCIRGRLELSVVPWELAFDQMQGVEPQPLSGELEEHVKSMSAALEQKKKLLHPSRSTSPVPSDNLSGGESSEEDHNENTEEGAKGGLVPGKGVKSKTAEKSKNGKGSKGIKPPKAPLLNPLSRSLTNLREDPLGKQGTGPTLSENFERVLYDLKVIKQRKSEVPDVKISHPSVESDDSSVFSSESSESSELSDSSSTDSEEERRRAYKKRAKKVKSKSSRAGKAKEENLVASAASNSHAHVDSRGNVQANMTRTMRNWHLEFAADGKVDPRDFLERLEDCKMSMGYPDDEVLGVVPCVLVGDAARWFRTARRRLNSWTKFKKAFLDHFGGDLDRDDIYDELRNRTQGEKESISVFLTHFEYIASQMHRELSERRLAKLAFRNLLKGYRHYMADKCVDTIHAINKYGRRYEKQRDLDTRYTPPPPKNKSRIPCAAYAGKIESSGSQANEKSEIAAINANFSGKKGKKGKGSKPKESEATGGDEAQIDALQQQRGQPGQAPSAQPAFKPAAPAVARPTVQPGNAWLGAAQAPAQGAPGASALPPRADNPGVSGACFVCAQVGHMARQCPTRACHLCGQAGHYKVACPRRNFAPVQQQQQHQQMFCQGCGAGGYTLRNCPNCEQIRQLLGNAHARV